MAATMSVVVKDVFPTINAARSHAGIGPPEAKPFPAAIPVTCVPWPSSSTRGFVDDEET